MVPFSNLTSNIYTSPNQNNSEKSKSKDTSSIVSTKPQAIIKKRAPKQPKNPQIKPFTFNFLSDSYFKQKPKINKITDEIKNEIKNTSKAANNILNINNNLKTEAHQKKTKNQSVNKGNKSIKKNLASDNIFNSSLGTYDLTQTNRLIDDSNNLSSENSNKNIQILINLNTINTPLMQINPYYHPYYPMNQYLDSPNYHEFTRTYHQQNFFSNNYYHLMTGILTENNPQPTSAKNNDNQTLNDSTYSNEKTPIESLEKDNNFITLDELDPSLVSFFYDENY
ncbi:MAG: hypothetical protein Q8K60_08425 [Parachlamydiaceae bacterium]|nr:hypothetical protein [Parachlamydiaceae bacterium]